ncbi:MAG TPA: DUF6632 domain-containing protein [Terriglobales bacterium]|nr:DUF6632 domain-containing protein [Terriglobales bacterium]
MSGASSAPTSYSALGVPEAPGPASGGAAANRSLIAFTAWSSFAHAAVMSLQSLRDVSDRGHLLGGSAAFVIIGVALVALAPAKQTTERASVAGL